jgi:ribonuclease BN (tRNA processing enzyme)
MSKLILSFILLWPFAVSAQDSDSTNSFITLGTIGGPMGEPNRSQPANALINGKDIYLVDAGDGAAVQLVKAGLALSGVQAVFLSHLHFDHTAGVLGVLGLRMQLNVNQPLHIYGPPGTQAFIDGLLAGMAPAMAAAYGFPGQTWSTDVQVTELVQGSKVQLDNMAVTVAENTHFSYPAESPEADSFKSLSFRFDLADRSIVYSGDTGPSEALVALANGANLLVSEMFDLEKAMARVQENSPNMPAPALAAIRRHFTEHHVSPQQVGEMAAAAEVSAVVITHMVPSISTPEEEQFYIGEIHKYYEGEVLIADDLDRF